MNKLRLISLIAICLFISNLAWMYFFVFQRPARRIEPKKIVIERLHLDDAQIKGYDKLIEWHQNEITKTENTIKLIKNDLYRNLSSNTRQQSIDSLINELGKVQVVVENIHYKHFEEIKKLCKDKQLQDFDSLTHDIAKIFAKPPIKRMKNGK